MDERMWLGIWAEWTNDESVSGDSLRRVVREVERRVGLVGPSHMPATDHATLTYRVIAALTSAALFNLESVEVRNGFLDSSGGWGGPREELFTRFPAMASRRAAHLDDDPLGQPAYRFWFVLRGTEPVLALEPASGRCWQLRKDSVDLIGLYRENGRRLWPVVVAVGSDVIEP